MAQPRVIDFLRRKMDQTGITQTDVARTAGVGQKTADIFFNERPPGVSQESSDSIMEAIWNLCLEKMKSKEVNTAQSLPMANEIVHMVGHLSVSQQKIVYDLLREFIAPFKNITRS